MPKDATTSSAIAINCYANLYPITDIWVLLCMDMDFAGQMDRLEIQE